MAGRVMHPTPSKYREYEMRDKFVSTVISQETGIFHTVYLKNESSTFNPLPRNTAF